jgi:hypothetical protein
MDAVLSSETLEKFYHITWYHIPGLISIYSRLLLAWISLPTDDGGSMSLRNIGELPDHTVSHPTSHVAA